MPSAPWKSWTKSLSCKSHRDEQVHSPVSISASAVSTTSTNRSKPFRSTCSRSLSNLKDVIHGNTKVVHKSASCSPAAPQLSSKSDPLLDPKSTFWNPTASEIISAANARLRHSQLSEMSKQQNLGQTKNSTTSFSSRRFGGSCHGCNVADEAFGAIISRDPSSRSSLCRYPHPSCQRCGETFAKFEALEHHHATKHAVTELGRGDSSKNIVEIIFRTSWLKDKAGFAAGAAPTLTSPKIVRVLKVNNTHRTISRFEEYRDTVKSRASSLAKKHARCIADGNELLRFHAASIQCRLGENGSSSICSSPSCSACRIIKSGFRSSGAAGGGGTIHTTATSGRAHDSMPRFAAEPEWEDDLHAMVVCRVIAGRMHRGFAKVAEHQISQGGGGGGAAGLSSMAVAVPSGFDSIAGEMGPFSNVDDLYVTSSRAVLPCFVVIYRWAKQ